MAMYAKVRRLRLRDGLTISQIALAKQPGVRRSGAVRQ